MRVVVERTPRRIAQGEEEGERIGRRTLLVLNKAWKECGVYE